MKQVVEVVSSLLPPWVLAETRGSNTWEPIPSCAEVSHDAQTVQKSLERRWGKLDPAVVKSLTCDQGKEMVQHEALAKKVKMKVYFCHPHSP